ncbi:2-keto-4-pentenoate hydratase [Actinospica sp.]|uniref:2-keto-4-pentenoate hydratase n=1 Tax=Actinospica sp. TaxID=1872142 RepID=UPI002C8159F8|nr:fumarylacetoacetate hydrolase family protein [Actinospica sp.]HWG24353.1 fumarylacetoacetate hydrolase family protein [Actinospica sp.]
MSRNPVAPEVAEAAHALAEAARTGVPCPPVRGLLGEGADEAAYAVQRINVERALAAGRRVVGRKIGLTSLAVQRQLGVDRPDFGALLDDMEIADGGEVPFGRLLQPKVEAEVAFVLGADLTAEAHTAEDVLRAIDHVRPALELVDSRIADWKITYADTVADNGSSGLFVLGAAKVQPSDVDVAQVRMTLSRNGEQVSAGTGTDCLGSPVNAAVWLADTLTAMGDPLRAGDVVLTGALGPMSAAGPGDVFEAQISGLGPVRVSFSQTPKGQ